MSSTLLSSCRVLIRTLVDFWLGIKRRRRNNDLPNFGIPYARFDRIHVYYEQCARVTLWSAVRSNTRFFLTLPDSAAASPSFLMKTSLIYLRQLKWAMRTLACRLACVINYGVSYFRKYLALAPSSLDHVFYSCRRCRR
jgi:hypothetical protein